MSRLAGPVLHVLVALLFTVPVHAGGAVTIHVDDDAAPGGDGSTWSMAFRHMADAMDLAASLPAGDISVLVAGGLYPVDRSAAQPSGSGDRAATVLLPDGIALIGAHRGLAAVGGEDPYDRDLVQFPSILDGAIGTVVPVDDALHVLTAFGSGVIDGVVVQNGFADGADDAGRGGGMYLSGAPAVPLVVRDCAIRDNFGVRGGGGALIDSNAVLEACTIVDNEGSGVRSFGGAPTFNGCHFEGNSGSPDGGGLYVDGGDPTLDLCSFTDNVGDAGGGLLVVNGGGSVTACAFDENDGVGAGLALATATTTITDCAFRFNQSTSLGGAAYLFASETRVESCGFENNSANVNGGAIVVDTSDVEIDLCEFELNSADLSQGGAVYMFGSTVAVTNSEFKSNFAGVDGGGFFTVSPGLSVADSLFCANTPVDIAGPADLLGGNEFLVACPLECPADVDGDGMVAVGDLLAVLAAWGACADCAEDIDGDGMVAVGDLLAVLGTWGDCG